MITLQHHQTKGLIQAMENGKEVGNVKYKLDKGILTITHTHAHMEGRGIGRLLVIAAIEYAQSQGMKIDPQCSYAKRFMNKTEKYQHLIASID